MFLCAEKHDLPFPLISDDEKGRSPRACGTDIQTLRIIIPNNLSL